MTEISSSPDRLKIPESWNFPEKSSDPTDIAVNEVNEGQNYLRFHLTTDNPMNDGEIEYFFSGYGEPLDQRWLSSALPHIFHWGEIDLQYTFERDLYKRFNRFSIDFSHRETDLLSGNVKELDKDHSKESMVSMTGIGGFTFTPKGELKMALIGMPFFEQDGSLIPVADIALALINGGNRLNASDYRPSVEEIDPKYMVADKSEANKIILKKIQGQDVFITEWGIKMEEDKRGRKAPFFVITRSHDTTGTVQTLRSPMQVDSDLITEAAFSKPPYLKGDKGRLVVPWRNLDRLIGASLSYSHPPPKK